MVEKTGRPQRAGGKRKGKGEAIGSGMEEALKENGNHLRSLLENARNFAVYRLEYDARYPFGVRVVFVSPSISGLIGVSEPMKFESWLENIHPEDIKKLTRARRLGYQTQKLDETLRFFIPQKKEWRWVRVISNGTLDEQGRVRYVNGTITDITEKMKAERDLQKARNQLERRVRQRTDQLEKMNEKLRFLSNQLINAQENERKRIAIELHDELGQSLMGLKFQLSDLLKRPRKSQKELNLEIEQALGMIDDMGRKVRRLSRDLRPSILEHFGLFEALQWLLDESARQYHLKIIKNIPESFFTFSQEQAIIIFRIFQEALTNIGKHARAGRVTITMLEKDKEAVFSIEDDGRGFDPKEVTGRPFSERGLGLTAMDERARMAGGALEIDSRRGKGTKIVFTVPLIGE
jgi:PAS domain S-box-containing protein